METGYARAIQLVARTTLRAGRLGTTQGGGSIYPILAAAPGSRRLSTVPPADSDTKKAQCPLCSSFSGKRAGRSGDVRRTGLILARQPPEHGEGPLDVSPHRSLRGLCITLNDPRQNEFMIRVAQL